MLLQLCFLPSVFQCDVVCILGADWAEKFGELLRTQAVQELSVIVQFWDFNALQLVSFNVEGLHLDCFVCE